MNAQTSQRDLGADKRWGKQASSNLRAGKSCSVELVRGTLVPHDVLKVWCPRLRRARPDLGCRFEPRCIVDRACLQEGYLRHRLNRAEYWRPAGRAEPPLRCAPIVLTGGLERGECVALNHECFARYAHDRRERRSGLALTVRAVTNPLPNWLSVDAIGHATAQAAACNGSGYIGHAPKTLLTPAFTGEQSVRPGTPQPPA